MIRLNNEQLVARCAVFLVCDFNLNIRILMVGPIGQRLKLLSGPRNP